MSRPRLLIQLDTDPQASTFDAIVALDAGADQLLVRSGVHPEHVPNLVHGALFTRPLDELNHTAIFIGGSDVAAGESLLEVVRRTFFGPFRVSVMLDSNGANTTAAAAVLAVAHQVDLKGVPIAVLGGTGPVGQRTARLLASAGALVGLVSRDRARAETVCQQIQARLPQASPLVPLSYPHIESFLGQAAAVISAGAAGVTLLKQEQWQPLNVLQVVVDLNAVPPAGIEGVEASDKQVQRHGKYCYGALGIGGWKMKIHHRAIQELFSRNDRILDVEEIFELGRQLLGEGSPKSRRGE